MVYEASFSGIIKILFWIFFISFLIRLIARMALPHVMRKAQERMNENARQFNERQQPIRPEGDVTIEKGKSSKGGSDGGDYINYVEIKD